MTSSPRTPRTLNHRLRRQLRALTALAVVALISLIGSGCGSSAPVGTGATASSGTGSTRKATGQAQGVKFAECMRNNGVPDFPDPDANGEFAYGVSVRPAVFTRATTACKSLEPPGALSTKRTPKQQSDSLRFAACMRSNGVADFPDSVSGEPLIDTTKIPSTGRPGGMTILNAAIAKCRSVLKLAAGGQGG